MSNSKKTVKNIKEKSNVNELNSIDLASEPVKLMDQPLKFKDLCAADQYNYLSQQKKLKQIVYPLTLNKIKRLAYRQYANKVKDDLAKEKKDFKDQNIFEVRNFNLWYKNGKKQALFDINIDIKKGSVTSLIGPSGCGKSTFLKNLNRMNDYVDGIVTNGNIWFNRINIFSKKINPIELRSKVGMVFQKPNPFEMSIYDNVAFGPKNHGIRNKQKLDEIVEKALKGAALWDDVKDDLHTTMGTDLSGGQQQRLCIARTIALEPEVILMDEPTSALDPIATSKIENLILELSSKVTIIIVTHSMAQAQRISDNTIFFYQGKIIESNSTKNIFTKPKEKLTKDYINGKIG